VPLAVDLQIVVLLQPLGETIIHPFGPLDIINTDQGGAQLTSFVWINRLKRAGIRISIDGKGRCIDNVFIERLWRCLKFECVYLHAWDTGSQAKARISQWMTFYNHRRPHSLHGGTPRAVFYRRTNAITQPDQQVQ
jgi:putative transposase